MMIDGWLTERVVAARIVTVLLLMAAVRTSDALTGLPLIEKTVPVAADVMTANLVCPTTRTPANVVARAPQVAQEALEIPSEEEVAEALTETSANATGSFVSKEPGLLPHASINQPLRVAIWGDSHLAAGFFTDELVKLLHLQTSQQRSVFLAATIGRPGVRLPYRKVCVSAGWRYEAAYANTSAAVIPGPGLVNMVADEAGATFAVDLRDHAGIAVSSLVRILYHQSAQPIRVGLSVDGATEQEIILSGAEGPGALRLTGNQPLSVIRLRVITGPLVFQGLEAEADSGGALQMDVFGFPGATAAGWRRAQLPYLSSWFSDRHYDLVMLMFGTNEGNVPVFDPHNYRDHLEQAVSNVRQVFADSACVLIGPGDRGVRVPHKRKGRRGRKLHSSRSIDLLKYAQVHAAITDIQNSVASAHGCLFFSLQDAMGGRGSAYRWVRINPPLMASDLTHFTPAGYRELARRFSVALHWDAGLFGQTP
jgi:lysophospholipase L1-like esterase